MAIETITALMTERQKELSEKQSSVSTLSKNFPGIRIRNKANFHSEVTALTQRYATAAEIMTAYNPDTIKSVMRIKDLRRIYMGKAPTLYMLSEAYGINTAEGWIEIQLQTLSEFIGVKEKLNEQNRSLMATLILSKHGALKMSEFLFFIGKIMSGDYTRFYSEVNAQTIMYYLNEFEKDRVADIARIEKEDAERAKEARRKQSGDVAITFAEYLQWKETQNTL